MEYSIITTSDKGYFPFLEILVNSVIEVCDVKFILKVKLYIKI